LLIIIIIIIIITTIVVPTKIDLIKNEERVNRDLTRNEVKVNIEGVKVNREGADIIIMMIEDKNVNIMINPKPVKRKLNQLDSMLI